ncbi:hypothetical protein OROMI_020935 [Orobanche minor]
MLRRESMVHLRDGRRLAADLAAGVGFDRSAAADLALRDQSSPEMKVASEEHDGGDVSAEEQLRCVGWQIPSEMCNNTGKSKTLLLYENQLERQIPPNIWKCGKLEILYLSDNNLSGRIPREIGSLSMLRELYLEYNHLTGKIPPEIGNLLQLEILSINNAFLSGNIPLSIFNMSSLTFLNLANNSLSGELPQEIATLQTLQHFTVVNNFLHGSIPSSIFNLSTLKTLDLSFNEFSGSLPSDMGRNIEELYLSTNKLDGPIPSSIINASKLTILEMSVNLFSGCIPNFAEMNNLGVLGLYGNMLVGSIAECFGDVKCLREIFLGSNHLNSTIPPNFWTLKDLMVLDLSTNNFIGMALHVEIEWRRISYIELERGTSSFAQRNLLGRGSYGSVFEATLSDGLKVAAKVFNLELQGALRSFDTETEIIGSIRHRNLVQVIGCCSNMEFKALILTYMPNGSLDKWLYSDVNGLYLIQRVKIAIDVAETLEYLHHGYTFPIIHCDVKSSNVLIDGDMVAHLSDFGISKLFDGGEVFMQTQTLATIGYAARELGTKGKVSTNGDVYSFGIMLLEMFTRKRPTDDVFGGEMSLKEWVIEALKHNAAIEIAAPALLSRGDRHFAAKEQCMSSIFELAVKCLAFSPNERINKHQPLSGRSMQEL